MTRLFDAAGVDYRQWRALLRTYSLVNLGALRGAYGPDEARRAAFQTLGMVGAFGLLGAIPAAAIWLVHDTFVGATLLTTIVATLTGAVIITQNPSIVAPEDYQIIGFRPVSSRTYLAARTAGVLLHVVTFATLLGYLPVVALVTRADGSLRLAAAGALATLGSALTMTFGLIAAYGWLMRIVSPSRLERIVVLAQALLPLGFAVCLVVPVTVVTMTDPTDIGAVSLSRTLAAWYPGAWFAAIVEIARGGAGRLEWTLSGLAAVTLTACAIVLRGRVSTDYALRVAEFMTRATPPRAAPRRRWTPLNHETRAVALIVLAHLRDNTAFQMHLLMDVAMTAGMVVLLGYTAGLPDDPFAGQGAGSTVIAFLVVLLPVSMLRSLEKSDEYQACWLFFTTPADRAKLTMAVRDVVALVSIGAIALPIFGFLTYAFRHPGHAAALTVAACAIGYVTLQVSVLVGPRLPFTEPSIPGPGSGGLARLFRSSVVPILVGTPLMILFTVVLARRPLFFAVCLAAIGGVSVAINAATRRRGARIRIPPGT